MLFKKYNFPIPSSTYGRQSQHSELHVANKAIIKRCHVLLLHVIKVHERGDDPLPQPVTRFKSSQAPFKFKFFVGSENVFPLILLHLLELCHSFSWHSLQDLETPLHMKYGIFPIHPFQVVQASQRAVFPKRQLSGKRQLQ